MAHSVSKTWKTTAVVVVALCLAAVRPDVVHAHRSLLPAFQAKYVLRDDVLGLTILVNTGDAYDLFKVKAEKREAGEQLPPDIRSGIVALVRNGSVITIDGIVVPPVVVSGLVTDPLEELKKEMVLPGYAANDLGYEVKLEYPLKSAPRRISIAWRDERVFLINDPYGLMRGRVRGEDEAGGEENPYGELWEPVLYVGFRVGDNLKFPKLTPKEPEYTWHAPVAAPREPVAPVSVDVVGTPWRLTVSALVLSLAYLASATVAVVRRRRVALHAALLPVACGLVTLAAYAGPVPLVTPRSRMPEAARAVEIFEALHANIYRAFDYDNEDDIYATLTQSVAKPVLYGIYEDVYQSLVLKDEGGAMCSIERVETLETDFLGRVGDGDDELAFGIECAWRVKGIVAHWGHVHERVNEYLATYTVARIAGAWKITDTKVETQRRIDTLSGSAP